MKFTKQKIRSIRSEINSLLQGLQQFEGLEINAGKCSFDQDVATFKLEVKIKGAKSQSEKHLALYADAYGLDLSKIGKEQGKSFSLVGYNSKASKYPFEMQELATGKLYKASHDLALRLFAKAVQNA
jgi:hypothetical protein